MSFFIPFWIGALLILLTTLYFYYIKIYKKEKFFENFPTPPTEFFYGNARQFKSRSEFLRKLHEYTETYGAFFHLKMGPFGHMLICSDPDFAHFLLNNVNSVRKGTSTRFMKSWMGNGLALVEGDRWRIRRKLLTPAFHFQILQQFINTFESCGDVMVKLLDEMNGNQSFDVYPYLNLCALDIICETAMGIKVDAQNNKDFLYIHYAKEMCRISMARAVSILSRYNIFFWFTKNYIKQKEALKYLDKFTGDVLVKKFADLKTSKFEENYENDMAPKTKKVFIDLVLEAALHEKISLEDTKHEVNTFIFAGHDTTANTSSFLLYCLANNKGIQDKLFKEQKEIFGNVENPKVTYNDLQDMRYLECVIKEGLRLYAAAPLTGRETTKEINYNGLTIPKGVMIYVFTRGIHFNPKYYPDPKKFDPERFEGIADSDTDEKQEHPFMPFGTGVRNCIGQKYAMLEMKSIISKIIRNFELIPASPSHKMELTVEAVLKSLNGVKIGIKLR